MYELLFLSDIMKDSLNNKVRKQHFVLGLVIFVTIEIVCQTLMKKVSSELHKKLTLNQCLGM